MYGYINTANQKLWNAAISTKRNCQNENKPLIQSDLKLKQKRLQTTSINTVRLRKMKMEYANKKILNNPGGRCLQKQHIWNMSETPAPDITDGEMLQMYTWF